MAGQNRSPKPAKRIYTLRQRRTTMDETRARIVDAAVDLFESVGPAATTMSAVAERAGVTRATLYRHFAGDADVANVVIDEWATSGASIDTAAMAAIPEPVARLRAALAGLYGSYRATETLTANLLRDAHVLPAERRAELRGSAGTVRLALGSARVAVAGVPGPASSPAAAIVGHAVAFETWRSLAAEGLDDSAIVGLMAALVDFAGKPASAKVSAPKVAKSSAPKSSAPKSSAPKSTPKSAAPKSKTKGKAKAAKTKGKKK